MLNNSVYQTIMRLYNRRQAEAKHAQDLRIQEIYQTIPEYEKLDQELVSLCASQARARILNPSSDHSDQTSKLHQQIERIKCRQLELLKQYHFPDSYPEIEYICPICKDSGFADGDLCECFRKAASEVIFDQSQLTRALLQENFNTFDINYYPDSIDPRFGISPSENMKAILMECHRYIKNFDTHFSNLFFTGDTGVGKSFLSHCIANELLKSSHSVLYLSSFDLIKAFEKHTFGHNEDEDSIYDDTLFDTIMNCDALFIDDLGTESVNNFTVSQLFLCLNHRQEHRKSTIISTNLPVESIQDIYSERISSRIISYFDIFLIFGDDIRIKIARSLI